MSLPADSETSIPIIHKALDLGINFFDTADIYNDGINETILGKAFKGRRNEVIIASKVGNVRRKDGSLDWNPSKKHIMNSIEGSLQRLGTDFIDLYQLHGGTLQDNIEETIAAFEELKKSGKIRFYGISSIRPNVIAEYVQKSSIVSVMTQYSLLDRRPEETTLPLLHKNNIGVLARGSVAQGLLIDKKPKNYLEFDSSQVKKAADAVNKFSVNGRTATHVALRYVLQNPAITSAVVGTRTWEQLEDAVQTFAHAALSAQEITALGQVNAPLIYREHRMDKK